MFKSEFGLIGLGVMGSNLAMNIAENGFRLSVYNRSEGDEAEVVDRFLTSANSIGEINGFKDLNSFVHSLEQPRKILLMVTSGDVVDIVIDSLIPMLEENDIIIDGGNSYFEDTIRRANHLQSFGLQFVGCGISGGAEGARIGPSLMPDGEETVYDQIRSVMESIAAKDKHDEPCCNLIGASGAGHFVKMIHNGIEYVEMQLLAEVFSLLSIGRTRDEVAAIFESWQSTSESSFILDITSDILKKKEGEHYLLDLVLDTAKNKGTGSWSSKVALELGYPADMINSAVFARYISSFKHERVEFASRIGASQRIEKICEDQIFHALQFARLINHQQGFELISHASKEFNWNISLSELARVWTNGCIIRSALMEDCSRLLKENKSLLKSETILDRVLDLEQAAKDVIKYGLNMRVSVPCLFSSVNYFTSISNARSSANLIQAQRDYFGAHTYQRIDAPTDKFFHSNWKNS